MCVNDSYVILPNVSTDAFFIFYRQKSLLLYFYFFSNILTHVLFQIILETFFQVQLSMISIEIALNLYVGWMRGKCDILQISKCPLSTQGGASFAQVSSDVHHPYSFLQMGLGRVRVFLSLGALWFRCCRKWGLLYFYVTPGRYWLQQSRQVWRQLNLGTLKSFVPIQFELSL